LGRRRRLTRRRWPSGVSTAASIAVLLLAWTVAAGLAASPTLPDPAAVWRVAVAATADGDLPHHLGVTLLRVVASFLVAMTIGTAIGIAMGRSTGVDRALDPWLIVLLNIPALVVIILAYVWIGLVEAAVIVAVSLNKIPNVVVTIREGARALDRDLLAMSACFRLRARDRLVDVLLPQLYPFLAAAARSGLALIWKIVLVAELLGRSDGVGFQLGLYFQLFDVAGILAYALAFVVIIQVVELVALRPLERRLGRWRR
jgi:NitT/TauT family transport system permease protein